MRYALTLLFAICLCSLAHGQGAVDGMVFGEGRDKLADTTVYLLQEKKDSLVQARLRTTKGISASRAFPRAVIRSSLPS